MKPQNQRRNTILFLIVTAGVLILITAAGMLLKIRLSRQILQERIWRLPENSYLAPTGWGEICLPDLGGTVA